MAIDNNNSEWVVPVYQKCPNCETGQLDTRIKRGFFVRNLFVWMNVKRYQCNSCGRKVYIKNHSQQHQLHF
jgi:ribosomal protein S27AE